MSKIRLKRLNTKNRIICIELPISVQNRRSKRMALAGFQDGGLFRPLQSYDFSG
jgi:hypothetical protein